MKNLTIKDILAKLITVFHKIQRFVVLIFVGVVVLMYGFLVIRINNFVQTEPSDDAITQKLNTVQRPKINQEALDTIKKLQDQNIEVQTLFKQARDNPFSE